MTAPSIKDYLSSLLFCSGIDATEGGDSGEVLRCTCC